MLNQWAPRSLVVFVIIALSILPLASAQNGGNFVAGINFAAGAPAYHSNTGYYDGGIQPTQVETGDFNGDGKLDIVVAGSCNGNVVGCPASGSVIAVYLSNGDGTFQAPILNGAGLPPYLRSIAVGDFNHDGRLDIAAAADCLSSQDCSSGTVTILLGNGNGTLGQSARYAINGIVSQANTLAVGDFNDDGYSDIAVGIACYNIPVNSCSVGSLAIFLSDGNGKLGAPTNYPTVGNGSLIPVVADFNDDDKLDVAAVSYYSPTHTTSGSSLTVLLGNGNGSFQAPTISLLPFFPAEGVVADDFNGDGKRDLAVFTAYATQILLGNGNGTFQSPSSYPVSGSSIVASDLNGDHNPDLVVGAPGKVTALMNKGDGTFSVGKAYALADGNGAASVAVGDFNADSKQDVVLTNNASGLIGILLGNGDGTLQGAVPANLTIIQNHSVLADMNGDGIQDLVGVAGCCVTVALGIGEGRFGPSMEFDTSISNLRGLVVADLNGDGHSDVIVNGYGTSSSAVAVLLGTGDGSLGSVATYPLSHYALGPPAVGYFSGGKKLGVAVVQESQNGGTSGVGILVGNGDGTLQPEVFTATSEIYPYQVVVGDFNKDGKSDVAAFGMLTAPGFQSVGAVTVLLGKGDGTLTVKPDPDNNPSLNPFYTCNSQNLCVFLESYSSSGSGSLGFGWSGTNPLALGDLDGDGNLDLILANECRLLDSGCSTGELAYYHGRGDGTFNDAENTNPAYELADANYLGVAVNDVNGDGNPDIVASTTSGVAVYLAPFTKPGTMYATSGRIDAEIPAIGDLNGDGSPDIAIANGSGTVELLFNRLAYAHPPHITSVSRNYGAYAANVTITGTNFGATQGASTVTFNGVASTSTSFFTMTWSDTAIHVIVPAGATTGNLVVTVGGAASNGVGFAVEATPVVTGISPVSGPVGTLVTLSGSGLLDAEGHGSITFGSITASIVSQSATSLQVKVPAGATTGPIRVHVNGAGANSGTFTVTSAAVPAITSLSRNYGAYAANVTITGTNFGATQGASTVTFNGTTATSTSFFTISWSNTSIGVIVPAGATYGNVVVHVGGAASNGIAFTAEPTPVVTGISPASGPVGTLVTLTGTGLLDGGGKGSVTFGSITAAIVSQSATSLQVKVPAGAATGPIRVHVNGAGANSGTFTVN